MSEQAKTQAMNDTKATLCGVIREVFEESTSVITSKHLPAIAEQLGMHPTTVRLQFYRWRAESSTPAAVRCRNARMKKQVVTN